MKTLLVVVGTACALVGCEQDSEQNRRSVGGTETLTEPAGSAGGDTNYTGGTDPALREGTSGGGGTAPSGRVKGGPAGDNPSQGGTAESGTSPGGQP